MNKIHLRIGSAADNQVVVKSIDVAPYHLELFCDTDGNVFITDLGSEQGTYINNRRLNGFQLLKRGDSVRFGQNEVFSWERFIPKVEVKIKPMAPQEPKIYENKKQQIVTKQSTSSSNKQLVLIYGLIILLVILLSLYL